MQPSAVQLLAQRGITVPSRRHEDLEEHWQQLQAARRAVDESWLGDYDIPLVFPARGHDRAE